MEGSRSDTANIRYAIFCVSACISFVYIFVYSWPSGNSYLVASALFAFLYFALLWIERDPFSPLVIFGLFLLLYSVSFPLLNFLGGTGGADSGNLLIIVTSGFLIYVGSIIGRLIFSFFVSDKSSERRRAWISDSAKAKQVSLILLVPLSIIFLYVLYLSFYSGAETKTELSRGLGGLGSTVYLFLFYFFVFCGIKYKESGKALYLMIFMIPFVGYYLIAGHRDLIVRSLLMVLLLLYISRGISKKGVLLILLAGVAAGPFTQAGKGLLSYASHFEFQLSLESFFSGEFVSQGRNFNWLLESPGLVDTIYSNMIFNDFLRFIYMAPQSSGSVFGSDFVGRMGGAGLGFTLPGELYFSGSYGAMILFGVMAGLVMCYFKSRSLDSVVGAAVYVMVLFAFSYSLRADFANLLSGVLKLSVLPAVVLFLGVRLLPSRNER